MFKRLTLAVLLAGAGSAWAQQVISAHSGVVHYVEGQVTIEGKAVSAKFGEFPDVKNGQTLATEDGRAEVLLTPGVILRVAENSSIQMVSNSRSDTRVAVLTGSTLIEVGELLPTNSITILHNDTHAEIVKKGLYRFDCDDPAKLRVYDGEARVTAGEQTLVARKGRQVLFGTVLDMSGFDTKDTDAFMRWASRRSEDLAQANISSARMASSSSSYSGGSGYGYGYGSGFMGMGMGSWAYNPYYGMFTYMPYGSAMYYSPYFGYPYYSPMNVGYFVPSTFSGSAYPINTATTSTHFSTSPSGSGGLAPNHGPFGTGVGTSAARGASTGLGSGSGATSGARSGGGMSGGLSSGAAGHAGGGGSRGR